MNQSIIDHIRSTTPKSTRNRYRTPEQRRDLLARYLILSSAGAALIGIGVIITLITL